MSRRCADRPIEVSPQLPMPSYIVLHPTEPIMRTRYLIQHGFTFAGLSLLMAGCVVHEHEPHVYHRPVREEIYVPPPPPPRYEERVVVEERYEPAPREAIVTYEEDLRPYGRWVETTEYGRCWVP